MALVALLMPSVGAWAQLSMGSTSASEMLNSATQSQGSSTQNANEDEERKEPKYIILKDQGLSLGVDLSPLITRLVKDERTGFAFVGRYGIINRLFAAAEVGYEHIKHSNDNFAYKSDGMYIRIGADWDIYNNPDAPTNDNIFIGLRYAYAWQTHESGRFSIVDDYWGGYEGSVGSSAVNSHSVDALVGFRCEVLRNFYMGWTVRGRFLLASTHGDELKPYAIAGYGKYDNKMNVGFTYTLEYQIPFNKLGKNR